MKNLDNRPKAIHWADIYAEKIVREKGAKDSYVCASGITPSGTVHIGNFREIISVDLVARALRDSGYNVRFIYSWDEYDVFRKVPSNMQNKEELEKYLRWPITLVPDPAGKEESYAAANEKELEQLLHIVGIDPEYLYQAKQYRASAYAGGVERALEQRETIRAILNEHRTEPLAAKWWPASVFCTSCNKDTTEVTGWTKDEGVSYVCSSCGNSETVRLDETGCVKLPWRIDWPMRWEYEKVDFEPAGKDHHSEGGSFDTARNISSRVYDHEPPVTFQYDFISIKGRGGKISSSTGEVVSLGDVLEVYQPEVVRYMFAGTRPNTEFSISFDLDVIKIYEDYDKCERIYFGKQEISEKKKAKELRIYELSQVHGVPELMPYQLPFRHLCNLLQINSGDIDQTIRQIGDVEEHQIESLKTRAECAWAWITDFAPEDFRYHLRGGAELEGLGDDLSAPEKAALIKFREVLAEEFDGADEKILGESIYRVCEESGIEPKDFFKIVYQVLIGKEKGPRLAGFILTAGKEKILPILDRIE
jgi:lysyl-tRNA synthetase, class I